VPHGMSLRPQAGKVTTISPRAARPGTHLGDRRKPDAECRMPNARCRKPKPKAEAESPITSS
jgi:hypothetical protein